MWQHRAVTRRGIHRRWTNAGCGQPALSDAGCGTISRMSSPQPVTTSAGSASPRPRRLRGPSWLDLRLIGGVLLVLVSVLVGARIVSAADQSVSVWAAAQDLSAGTTLRPEDVRAVPVRLFDSGAAYLRSSAVLTGQILDRPVRAGELLPASALREQSDRVSVALPVPTTAVPLDLHRGQLIDVYATGEGIGGDTTTTRLVLAAAPVQAIDGGSQGALSASSGMRQVVVSVPSGEAGDLLAAIAGRELAVAILDDLSEPANRAVPAEPPGPPAPSTSAAAPSTSAAAPSTSAAAPSS